MELWKIKDSETYMIIRNIDKNNEHYEYYPFLFNGHLFIFNEPHYIKTNIIPEFGFIPYDLLPKDHAKLAEFYE